MQEKTNSKKSKSRLKMSEVKNNYWSIFNEVNPFQPSVPNSERLIRLLTLVFGIFSIYLICREFDEIIFLFSEGSTYWEDWIVMHYLPLILLVSATFLFWFRLKIGWIMMCVYLTFSITMNLGFLILFWDGEPLGTTQIDSIFPRITAIYQILTILFISGGLWIIAKNETLKKFSINRKIFFVTICISAVLTFLFEFPGQARAFILWFV